MKKTACMGIILVSALLGTLLVTNRDALGVETQTTADNVETNLPAVRTVLESTLPEDVQPSSAYAQLIRMVQAGVDKAVILAYIEKSSRFFELDADDIIYLTDLGTPPDVIEAAMARDDELFAAGIVGNQAAATAADEAVTEQPPEVTVEEFYDTLSPYGTWVDLEGYGRCWRPTIMVRNSDWRPYCDNGRWVYTDHGWYWMSNYSWGWATFHYGRWFHHTRYGWCWWPDTVWAPSWVYWRYNNDYCGWAPLPPHTIYRSGVGLVYRGSSVGAGFSFNLTFSSFTFVSARNFCDPNPRRYIIDRRRVPIIYPNTKGKCRYDQNPRGRTIISHGVPAEHIRKVSRRTVRPVSIQYSRRTADRRLPQERLDNTRNRLLVSRPNVVYPGLTAARRDVNSPQKTVIKKADPRPNSGNPVVRPSRKATQPVRPSQRATQPVRTQPRTVKQQKQTPVLNNRVRTPGTSRNSQPGYAEPRTSPPPASQVTRPRRSTPQPNRGVQQRSTRVVTPNPRSRTQTPAVQPPRTTRAPEKSTTVVSAGRNSSRANVTRSPRSNASSARSKAQPSGRPASGRK